MLPNPERVGRAESDILVHPAQALIGGLVASNVDNVIRPLIYRRVSGLHPMASLLGAFAGLRVLGILGLLLGPRALAYWVELVILYQSEYGGLGDDLVPP